MPNSERYWAQRRLHYSMQDYLSAAEISVVKLEYFDGEPFCMAGGTPEHAAIAAETTIRLGSKLKSWETREFRPGESVLIPGVGVTLSVDDFYGAVALKPT
ncbi:MAG: hypothetical protein JNJ54_28170 [Myxococcaceae bacterium]|nr:hypothetical protein [Myxococcaceae bacterium]